MKRWMLAALAALLVRYPVWLFVTNAADLLGHKIWDNNFAPLCKWDCGFYATLVENLQPSAFFPLFSALAKPFALIPGVTAVGATLVLSNIFSLAASFLALYLGEAYWQKSTRKSWWGFKTESWLLLLLVSTFQHSHFWIRAYPEALFFFLFSGGILAQLKNRPHLASVCFGLSSITKPQGIWLLAIWIGFRLFENRKPIRTEVGRRDYWRDGTSILISIAPFAGFLIWNLYKTQDAFYFLHAQSAWGRKFDFWQGLKSHLPRYEDNTFHLYAGLAIVGGLWNERKNRNQLLLAAMTLALLELPLWMGGTYSYSRFQSVNLGLFLGLVTFVAKRPPLAAILILWNLARLASFSHWAVFGSWQG